MRSDEILDEVKTMYRASATEYRNSRIALGRKIHEYIVAFLTEYPVEPTPTKRDRSRRRDGFQPGKGQRDGRRRDAVNKCAAELGITSVKVCNIVRVAMVVELLSDNGNIGDLAWATILEVTPLVSRKPVGEEWAASSEYDAVNLFRKIVELNLPRGEVRLWLDKSKKNNVRVSRPCTRVGTGPELDSVADVVLDLKNRLNGSPADAAELLFEMIKDTDNPKMILAKLEAMVVGHKSRHEFAL